MGRGPGYPETDAVVSPSTVRAALFARLDPWLNARLIAAEANAPRDTCFAIPDWLVEQLQALREECRALGVRFYVAQGPTGVWSLTLQADAGGGQTRLKKALQARGLPCASELAQTKTGPMRKGPRR